MQIDLMQVSTVVVVNHDWTEGRFIQQTRELLALADDLPEVRAAKRKFDKATAEVERFRARQSALNDRAIALSKTLAESREGLRRAILAGDAFEDVAFTKQGVAETEYKGCNSALEMLVTEILPVASADLLEAEVDYLYTQADGILHVANARASNIAEQLSAIADSEGSIEVNVSGLQQSARSWLSAGVSWT